MGTFPARLPSCSVACEDRCFQMHDLSASILAWLELCKWSRKQFCCPRSWRCTWLGIQALHRCTGTGKQSNSCPARTVQSRLHLDLESHLNSSVAALAAVCTVPVNRPHA